MIDEDIMNITDELQTYRAILSESSIFDDAFDYIDDISRIPEGEGFIKPQQISVVYFKNGKKFIRKVKLVQTMRRSQLIKFFDNWCEGNGSELHALFGENVDWIVGRGWTGNRDETQWEKE
jgi:hypothetical protein